MILKKLNRTAHAHMSTKDFCMISYGKEFIRAQKIAETSPTGHSAFITKESYLNDHPVGKSFAKGKGFGVIRVENDKFVNVDEGYFFFENKLHYLENNSQKVVCFHNGETSEVFIPDDVPVWSPVYMLAPDIDIDYFNDLIDETDVPEAMAVDNEEMNNEEE